MPGPLEGVKVVDAGRVGATPWASVILADLGAEVIKVESKDGDFARRVGAPSRNNVEAWFINANRGKRSIAVDLSDPDGIAVVKDLCGNADVFLENFRPGVMERIGLGYEQLSAVNSSLIYCSVSGFGSQSPYAHRGAYDTTIQALTGVAAGQRAKDSDPPQLVRQMIGDKVTAWTVVQTVLAALVARGPFGGVGQRIEVPMLDSLLYFAWPDTMVNYTFVGDFQEGSVTPKVIEPTKTSDGYIAQLAASFKQRHGLLRAVGRPGLCDDSRFASSQELFRPENLAELRNVVAVAAAEMDTTTLIAALDAEGVPCSIVLEPEQVLEDDHVTATNLVFKWEDPVAGPLRSVRYPAQFDSTPLEPALGYPALGGDGRDLLLAAGWAEAEIDRLVAGGSLMDPQSLAAEA
jgi:crotonobetainyl-CoA:carnitine CoA-transferase CaiB-like acyl-CoA transferase